MTLFRRAIVRGKVLPGWGGVWAAACLLAGLYAVCLGLPLHPAVASDPTLLRTYAWVLRLVVALAALLLFAAALFRPAARLNLVGLMLGWTVLGGAAGVEVATSRALRIDARPGDRTVLARIEECFGPPEARRFRGTLWAEATPEGWRRLDPPLAVQGRADLRSGSAVLLRGTLRVQHPQLPAGARPRLSFQVERAFALPGDPAPDLSAAEQRRYRWAARLEECLGPQAGALAEWALLDVRPSGVGPEWSEPFRRTGTSHLLSISGLHLVLIGGMFLLAARVLLRGSVVSLPISVAALLGYTAFVGAPPAAMRAAGMALFAVIGARTGRMARSWNLLAWSAVLLALLEPSWLLEPPLVLSLSAMAGVFLGGALWSALERRLHLPRAVAGIGALLSVSVVAVALTSGWSFYFFGATYWGGVLANLIAVPAMGIVLPCLFVGALAVACGAGAGHPLVWVARVSGEAMLALVRRLAEPSSATLVSGSVGYFDALLGAVLCGLLGWMFVRWIERRRVTRADRWMFGAVLLPLLIFAARSLVPSRERFALDVLPVGQGDAALLRTRQTTWLFDLGPGGAGGGDPLIPALLRRGVTRLERVWISHGDLDHWGGIESLLASAIAVDTLVLAEGARMPATFWSLLAEGRQRPVLIRTGAGWSRHLEGGVLVSILHPLPGVPVRGDNDGSLVLQVEVERADGRRLRLLLPADLEREGEARLLRELPRAPLSLLQAGHHGSKTSSSEPWLDYFRPRLAYASLAEANRFGFPHPELLARYRERGIPLLRLDRDGALELRVAGDHVRLARAP